MDVKSIDMGHPSTTTPQGHGNAPGAFNIGFHIARGNTAEGGGGEEEEEEEEEEEVEVEEVEEEDEEEEAQAQAQAHAQAAGGTIAATPINMSAPPSYMAQEMGTQRMVPRPHSAMLEQSLAGHFTMSRHIPTADSVNHSLVKKKRGRPRKYGQDGTVAITIKGFVPQAVSSPFPPTSVVAAAAAAAQRKSRGRPPGSGKKQQLGSFGAAGEYVLVTGSGFTPHAITIGTGEDVAARILSFSQQGSRGICILSANGAISNVTLRQLLISGGVVTYEGRFEILSLSGSFLVSNTGGARSRTGGLSVSLAGPDGRVVGGGVAGVLIAASPVQVVVGSFACNTSSKAAKPSKPLPTHQLLSPSIDGSDSDPHLPLNDAALLLRKPGSPSSLDPRAGGNGDRSNRGSPRRDADRRPGNAQHHH